MKIQPIITVLAALTTFCLTTAAQDSDPPTTNAPATDASATDPTTPDAPPANAPVTNAQPDANADQQAAPADNEPTPTNGLVLNFHDAPLSAVLKYLAAKAGLIIESDVNFQGKVNVVSLQPLTTNDIVSVLNDQLGKNNYAAVLVGRRLTIMTTEQAKTFNGTPVRTPKTFSDIPMDDEVVTEILPLHTLQAQQLVKDLADLIPRSATVSANEAGNSIIMTAPQKDIHRIDEIINALDGSALSEVVVTPLSYADAKAVATELKEIFQTEDSNITRASTRNNFSGRGGGRGGGGFPGGGGMAAMFGGGGGGGGAEDASKNVDTHAVFVSDDQLNAVISSAPPDYMRMITNVIADLDKPSQETTLMRVFPLKHADPGEIADELTTIFPSTTTTDQNNRSAGFRFGPFGGMGQQPAANSLTPRMKLQTTVMVVPDRRTQSVLVSASKDMMEQIDGVIKDLDKGDAGDQIVTAIDFGAADPYTVQETMSGLFSSPNSKTANTTQTATPLSSRATGNANSQTTAAQSSAAGSGSTGTGGTPGIR
jgi:type II secretory pathway component GspD/PulD (secretin)